jgi:Cu-Zn family superoxide dismutase
MNLRPARQAAGNSLQPEGFAMRVPIIGIFLTTLLVTSAQAEPPPMLGTAAIQTAEGKVAGTATLMAGPHGLLVTGSFNDLPPGEHGFHIHEIGACTPDFTAAGGHLNPFEREHGFVVEPGFHAGDMPNIHVGADGTANLQIFNTELIGDVSNILFDEDGSAFVVHAGPDDYMDQDSAGDRIACGVIEPAQ